MKIEDVAQKIGIAVPQTDVPAHTKPTETKQAPAPKSDSETGSTEGYDTDDLVDDTDSSSETQGSNEPEVSPEELERQQKQKEYDEQANTVKDLLSGFDTSTITSADYKDLQGQVDKLKELGGNNLVTVDQGTIKAGDTAIDDTEDYKAMTKKDYDAMVSELEALQSGDLTKDVESFNQLVSKYSSQAKTIQEYADGSNKDLLQEEIVYLTPENQESIKKAIGSAMGATMANSVDELYQSNDYLILTGEKEATEEEIKQARSNFEAQKKAITETGKTFGELQLPLPENCQITEVVDWGTKAKEGDKFSNGSMSQIIANYLDKNGLEEYITPKECYDMIMKLNPDIYEEGADINRYIYSGQQFLMPDASAIRNKDSVSEKISSEAYANLAEKLAGEGATEEEVQKALEKEFGKDADLVYDYKSNTVTVKDSDGNVSFYNIDGEATGNSFNKEDIEEDMLNAIQRSFSDEGEITLNGNGIELLDDNNGKLTGKYTVKDADGNDMEVTVSYDPTTGKSVINDNYTFDKNKGTVSYYDDNGNKTVETNDEEGNTISTTSYGTDGKIASVKVGDTEYTLSDITKDNENMSDFAAKKVLEQIAGGTDFDTAVKNVQEGNYSSSSKTTIDLSEEELEEAVRIAENLGANKVQDVEYKKKDGKYVAEIPSGDQYDKDAVIKVEYDPETGITTKTRYSKANDEDSWTSKVSFDNNTNTEITETTHKVDGEDVTLTTTKIYSDNSLDDKSLLVKSFNDGEGTESISTYKDGKVTETYTLDTNEGGIEDVKIKGANGKEITVKSDEIGSALTSQEIKDVFNDIKNGVSPREAFQKLGENNIINQKMIAENIIPSETSFESKESKSERALKNELISIFNGTSNIDNINLAKDDDGNYTATYDGYTYNVEKSDNGIITLTYEDEANGDKKITYDSNNLTRIEEDKDHASLQRFGYDDEGNKVMTDEINISKENEKLKVTIKDANNQSVTINESDLKNMGTPSDTIAKIKESLEEGWGIEQVLQDYGIDKSDLAALSFESSRNAGEEKEKTYQDFISELNNSVSNNKGYEYLYNNLTTENIGKFMLEANNNLDNLNDLNYIANNDIECGKYIAYTIANADIENMTDEEKNAFTGLVFSQITDTNAANNIRNLLLGTSYDNGYVEPLSSDKLMEIMTNEFEKNENMANYGSMPFEMYTAIADSASDTTSKYNKEAIDILAKQIEIDSYPVLDVILSKDTIDSDLILKMSADKNIMDHYSDNSTYSEKLANAYSKLLTPGNPNKDKAAKAMAQGFYDAVKGVGSRKTTINALIDSLENNPKGAKEVAAEFEQIAGKSLISYLDSQWGQDKDRMKALKELLK